MLQRAPQAKLLNVLVATPVAATGQGGIDRVMAALKGELGRDPRGISARFAATRGGGHIATSPLHLSAFLLRMMRDKAAGRLDLVHINIASNGSTYRKLMIAALARALDVPYVVHLHGADYRLFWTGDRPWLSACIQAMFEGAARIVVLGRVWRDFVAERAPAAGDRIVIVPNACEPPSRPHVGGGDLVHLLFLGRIGDRKGVPQLGEALFRMKGIPGWRATIAGDGNVEGAREKAAEYGLTDRVDIPGWVGAERVAELMTSADILVLPSFSENLPVSIIEAMASGVAVVATPVGAVEDIVTDGQTGLLVPPGDVEALAAAMTRLVEDPTLRQQLGAAGLTVHRDKLDLVPFADTMQRVWAEAAAARRGH
jgi:glycosyltransferase involved in cell wall biosynthesis